MVDINGSKLLNKIREKLEKEYANQDDTNIIMGFIAEAIIELAEEKAKHK